MSKIGIISNTYSAIGLAEEISERSEHELIVEIGFPNAHVLKKAQRLERERQVSAIIAPGAIYDEIYTHMNVPVIRLQLTNYEIAKSLHQASKLGKQIVFVDFMSATSNIDVYDPESVQRVFDYAMHRISMRSRDEVKKIVGMILNCQYDVVLSTAKCLLDEIPPSLHKIEVIHGKADLAAAVSQAIQAIEISTREKEKLRRVQTIVETFEEGMITCDKIGNIETFNAAAEEITGLEAHTLIGRNIKDLLSNEVIGNIYGNGSSTVDEMITLDTRKLVINRIPIDIGSEPHGLVIKIQKVTKIQALEREIRKGLLKKGFVAKTTFADIAGKSDIMRVLKIMARKYAASYSNILITGESGTGKELFAQSIHGGSPCHKGPFVAVSCAALPESLLESELFGYEEGAFTGAKKGGKAGLFELAHNGTIFLDEIGDMPLSLQSRLLRVLQEKEVIRLGGSQVIPVNNRIICATNKNLAQKVEEGLFREDLYYRINILQIHIPPLREHPEDIPLLARLIFEKKCKGMKKEKRLRPDHLQMLKRYHWPGNVRQLEAFLERLLVLTDGPEVEHEYFVECLQHMESASRVATAPDHDRPPPPIDGKKLLVPIGTMVDMEKEIIYQVLKQAGGDRDKTERTLGISRTTLWRKIKDIEHRLPDRERNQFAV